MSKSKSSSKAAKPAKPEKDILTKVKDAAVTKPAQTIKSKTKELAKQVAGKEEKKDKKNKKKAKEPTPEPSDSESDESASSASSESESEDEVTKPVTNGKVAAAKNDSDSASSSESEDEAPKTNGKAKASKKPVDDSDESMGEAASSDDSSDESSDDEKTTTKAVKATAVKNAAKSDSDSDSEADDDSDSSEDSDEGEKAAAKPTKRKADDEAEPAAKKTKTDSVDSSRGPNLFVGNLSWNVDEAWLKEVFEEFGELSGVRIVTERDTGRSKGFGYVEFVNAEDAAKAHAAKSGADLDGRALNVDFANPRPDNSQKQENRRKSYGDQVSEPSDTLFVGNLSFEVGQETVTEAFAPHGTILGIRLPTDRETGEPKGFGYVTFSSVEEAQTALEAMSGAYIEGRPIRLDYSSPRPQNGDSPARGRGGFGGRGGPRGGSRGGARGRGGFDRGGRGGRGGFGGRGGRGSSTNRGGFGDFSGKKTSFD